MAIGSPQWMYSSGANAYELDQSLKFDNDQRLTRTPTSSGNRKTFTFSAWVKVTTPDKSERNQIFCAGTAGAANDSILVLNGSDNFAYLGDSAGDGSWTLIMKTDALVRDPSAWYHIVYAIDTTQSTASNRGKIYINGNLASLSDYTAPSQNADLNFNNTIQHWIGDGADTNGDFDGYITEVNFIDGQALTPADFGETGDYGEWKPIEYSGSYGTNGFYLNFAGGGVMSATGGNSTVTDGDYKAVSFTSDGTFTPSANGYVEYLVIGGGGGTGATGTGGGGAGGYRTGYLPVTGGTAYSITVGAGGAAGGAGSNGGDSVFSSITSTGGGAGYGWQSAGNNGGSGGGAGARSNAAGGSGNTPSTSPSQGNDGGNAQHTGLGAGAGGGGAGGAGGDHRDAGGGSWINGGHGGAGLASSITGSSVIRAGGGGGGQDNGGEGGTGGSGGGGNGTNSSTVCTAGAANTGSGGGGGGNPGPSNEAGAAGGSGIVIIRYKFQ
jgi:hypothetical protein